MKQIDGKKWTYGFLTIFLAALLLCAVLTIVVDPYFHYHKPLNGVSYELNNERYMNDGIARHFDYDAVIIGTSMTHNFKTSEFDVLFDVNAIKVPYSGAGYKELGESLDRLLSRNPEVKKVMWVVDFSNLLEPDDWERYSEYPEYLYDNNALNDTPYLLNKSVMYHGVLANLISTLQGKDSTTFDEYSAFDRPTGENGIAFTVEEEGKLSVEQRDILEEELQMVQSTITKNIKAVIDAYPDTEFLIVIPPYHESYLHMQAQKGLMNAYLDAEKEALRILCECSNAKLYCYMDMYEVVCNIDYYSDSVHYTAEINSEILQWIAEDMGRITADNYEAHVEATREFYLDYIIEEK
ncbi:MAG: hypothetical protein IJ485_07460 [Lachnospiraceae bacterium]|nr:hypothetical protein [Lachnospiraceae bacterium]